MDMRAVRLVGLISDTHGLLREETLQALRGVDLILHAGDVGAPEILEKLKTIAPVVAVKGNIDTASWSNELPATAVVELEQVNIYMLHDLTTLNLNPSAAGFHCVVSGHSHKPSRAERDGMLYVNPGSAGPRRFDLPVTLARFDLRHTPWKVEFIELLNLGKQG
jgi:uncharacterized protein